jgi:hypothetical protein
VHAPELVNDEPVAFEELLRRSLGVHTVIRELTVVVQPEQPRDLLGVRVAIRKVRDVEDAARTKDARDLIEASVGVVDVLEDAARKNGVEACIVEGQANRFGAQVSVDLRKPLEWLGCRRLQIRSIVERDRVNAFLSEHGRDLAPAAAPVQHPAGPALRQIARQGAVLEHLRARPKVGVKRSDRRIVGE